MDITALNFFLMNNKRVGFSTNDSEHKATFFVVWRQPNGKYYIRERGINVKSKPKKITYRKALKMVLNGNNQQMLKYRRDW